MMDNDVLIDHLPTKLLKCYSCPDCDGGVEFMLSAGGYQCLSCLRIWDSCEGLPVSSTFDLNVDSGEKKRKGVGFINGEFYLSALPEPMQTEVAKAIASVWWPSQVRKETP